ncbi:carotenoid ester lipase [Trametes polyzona]|nr:carotenoid ester lipase [Trametes polyzona]
MPPLSKLARVFSILCVPFLLLEQTAAAIGPTVTLDDADVVGVTDGIVAEYLGIPYAQPPVSNLRFQLPRPVAPYSGILNAAIPGNPCFQQALETPPDIPQDAPPEIAEYLAAYFATLPQTPQSEDCLNINVMVPAGVLPDANLPVAVWIYGGGYEVGNNTQEPGSVVVTRSVELGKPVIFVAMNYRLNGFGFLGGKEVEQAGLGNLGLHDQRLALRWVQKYISAFGGDPRKVTIWGESAGAWSVTLQMTANGGDTEGLFRAAWMQSGSTLPTRSIRDLQPTFDFIASQVGCGSSTGVLDCLRGVLAESITAAVDKTQTIFTFASLSNPWTARFDGVFVKENSQQLVLNGKVADIPFVTGEFFSVDYSPTRRSTDHLAGNDLDEGTIFSLAAFNITTDEELEGYLKHHYFPHASQANLTRLLKLYPDDPAAGSPFGTGDQFELGPQYKRLAAIQGDLVFQGMRRFLLRKRSGTQVARSFLNKRGRIRGVGVPHGAELSNVFGGGDMTDFLVRFVTTLDPNDNGNSSATHWPAYTRHSPHMLAFTEGPGNKTLEVVSDTYREEAIDFIIQLSLEHPF